MAERQPTAAVLTQGCKVNQYESEAIAEALEKAGFCITHGGICDLYVVNTCTVTAESDRKAGQLIRRLHSKAPEAAILVTGCFAQVSPDTVAALPGVVYIAGNGNKMAVVKAAKHLVAGEALPTKIAVDVIENADFEPMHITKFERTRAYVKIEDGCENRCTYCAIPGARGLVRSKTPSEVLCEVRGLVTGGCREVVLTGIETASFGRDLGDYRLIDLLEEVDALPGRFRVRLGSLDPSILKEDFVKRAAKLRTLCPHFHLSIQSGSSSVLAAMKRKYNRDMALAGIARLRDAIPSVQLTADLIVGFPGETDVDFADTMELAREARFLQMHVFAYSKRVGTPAAVMPGQIAPAVKKARSAALIALGTELRAAQMQNAQNTPIREVLFETFEGGVAIGHTADFFEVAVPSARALHAEFHQVRLTGADGARLLGTLTEEVSHGSAL